MNTCSLKGFSIGNLSTSIPIVQGGMGVGISLSRLAAAVANEGGIGVISSAMIGMLEPDVMQNFLEANKRALRREIRKARELTKGVLGVNIMVALSNFKDLVVTSINEGIDIIFAGAGLPLNLPSFLQKDSITKLVPIVSSAKAISIICKRWLRHYEYLPDAVVVEGPKAGGHLGLKKDQLNDPDYQLEKLVPEVVEALRPYEEEQGKKIPVIAAGGIYTGYDIYKYINLGAAGVQMGTRFVATPECDAAEGFKQAYILCEKDDITIIDSPVGMPGRAIRNRFIIESEAGKRKPFMCPYHCVKTCNVKESPYCIANALVNAQRGDLEQGFAFVGENAYKIDKIVSVRSLIETLKGEYEDACRDIASVV